MKILIIGEGATGVNSKTILEMFEQAKKELECPVVPDEPTNIFDTEEFKKVCETASTIGITIDELKAAFTQLSNVFQEAIKPLSEMLNLAAASYREIYIHNEQQELFKQRRSYKQHSSCVWKYTINNHRKAHGRPMIRNHQLKKVRKGTK